MSIQVGGVIDASKCDPGLHRLQTAQLHHKEEQEEQP
jgi:hypothetical protein